MSIQRVRAHWGMTGQLGTTASGILVAGRGCITDLMAYETTGSASATINIYDGTSANGRLFRTYTLSSGQSTSEQWGHHWAPFDEGIYLSVVSGATSGEVTMWADHDCMWWLVAPHLAAEAEASEYLAAMAAVLGKG